MKISVITTLFNYRNYIGECIESFLRQRETDSEMIIVDDASSDDPWPIIKPYSGSRVKYIHLSSNQGYSYAKNVGIKDSLAEVLVMLDADDMLTDNSLEIRYRKLMEGYDLVHGPATDLIKGKKHPSTLWKKWLKNQNTPVAYKGIHAQTVMLRKEMHRKVGLYDSSLRSKSDREMWARILNRGFRVGWVDEPVCLYRMHDKQMHKSKAKLAMNDELEREVCKKIEIRRTNLSGLEMLK